MNLFLIINCALFFLYEVENWIFSIYSYYQGLSGAKAVTDPKLYGSKRMSIDKDTVIEVNQGMCYNY